jgi:molecular chaperone GrpE
LTNQGSKGTKGNGSPPDENAPAKMTVVDRRHHAQPAEDSAASPGAETRYPSFVEELKDRVEIAEKRMRQAVQEAHSEVDAVRARLQRDVERRVMEGKSRLLGAMLEVLDNLDRAAKVAAGESKLVADGIELIRKQMLAVLKSEGVEPIETLGLEYDPNVAEAVVIEAVEPARGNLILEEIQRGYRHGDTILRAARVKVGKATAGN